MVSDSCPRVSETMLARWDGLITQWLADASVPLLVRRSGKRGTTLPHPGGRTVVAVDNSPAHWAVALALKGVVPTLDSVHAQLRSGELPVVFAASKKELSGATYSGLLGRSKSANWVNKDGWKVCHIDPVGLRGRKPLTERPLSSLEVVARRLVTPRNMFLVPKDRAGFGELPEVIEVARRLNSPR